MSKLILSLDGGGIRGAASIQFLCNVEAQLQQNHQVSIRDCVDLYAGTSTGAIIALALATTELTVDQINTLYNAKNAREIFTENRGLFEFDGINAPKYEASGKTALLKRHFGTATLANAVKNNCHALAVTFGVEYHRPLIFKTTKPEHHDVLSYLIADASSAAPTYFPSVEVTDPEQDVSRWLVDGGVVANNPTMCAIAESRRLWPDTAFENVRVVSIGTGKRTRKVNGPDTTGWGALQWMRQGHIIDVLSDEQLVAYQALTILPTGRYIRVNAQMKQQPGLPFPPDDAMDDISEANINKLKALGDMWFAQYGQAVVAMLLNAYDGPSLDAIDPSTGTPLARPEPGP